MKKMKNFARLLSTLCAVLFLTAGALSAQSAAGSAGEHPRAVNLGNLGDHGVIERGQGKAGTGRWKGFPISLSLRDAPLPEVLRTFARLVGFNLILAPSVQGTVTAELKDVPWDQALDVILKTNKLAAEVDGRIWWIAPK